MQRTQPSAAGRSGLLLLSFGLISAPLQQAMSADGTWIGNVSNVAPNGIYSNPANWAGGVVGNGVDSTASFVYNPVSDAGGTVLAGGLIMDTAQTVGNLVFDDTDGYGSSTIGFNNGGTPLDLTFDRTTGTPTITTGQLLNSISGGKKVVINQNIQGNDGLTINGPGYIGLRGSLGAAPASTSNISGGLSVNGGVLQLQSQFSSITSTTVANGGNLFLDFTTAGVAGVNRIGPASTLTLGGPGGSGVVTNANTAAATHSQTFGAVTLNAGAHQIIANTSATQNFSYTLGNITANAHSALNLVKTTAASIGGINITNANNANGILGGWATYGGGDFAINNGSGVAAALATYTNNAWAAGNNTNITSNAALSAAATGTLRLNNGTAFRLDLTGNNVISSGGLISSQQSPLITGGTLTSGTNDLIAHVNGGVLRVASNIADGSAGAVTLVKSLGGTLQLENNMSYTGGTVLGAGTIIVGSGPLGGGTGALGSGAVTLSANNTGTGAYSPSGTLAFNRSGTHTVTNAINPAVNGGGYLAQVAGGGTLILNQAMKVGGFIQQAGTTKLDFNAAGAPASQIIDGSFTTGPTTIQTGRLIARNGTLEIAGKNGAATVQDFALTEVLGTVNLNVTAGAGGTAALNLGAISHPVNNADGGGTLALKTSAGASVTTNSGTASSLISDAGSPYVTVNGNDWGAKDAANKQIVGGSTLAGFYTSTTGAGLAASTNVNVVGNDSVTGAIQTSSIRFDTAGANTLTVNAAGTLRPGGILVSSNVGASTTTIAGTGDLRSATGNRDLTLIQNNTAGKLTIATPVVNFDATNLTHLVKAGAGEVELTSSGNVYTGRTFINEGTLRVSGSGVMGTSAARTGNIFARNGELVIQDSASVYTSQYASIGQRQGENGTLTVKGNGVFDIAADFNISDVNSRGTLNIADNATVTTRTLFVGKGGYSEGIVNQTGGTLIAGNTPAGDWLIGGNGAGDTAATGTYNISGGTLNAGAQNLQIGRWGTGALNISGSGAVSSTGFNVIGRFNTGTGTVNITGNGSWDTTAAGTGGQSFLIVGETGAGTLNVGGNGSVLAKSLSLAHNGGTGTVNQTGGTIDLTNVTPGAAGTAQPGVLFGATNTPGTTLAGYGGTYNLNGGLLKTFGVQENPAAVTAVNSTFNFNGGTIQAKADNAGFIQGLDLAAVKAGGAKIDSSTFRITIGQALVHDAGLGATADGGLTKSGSGTLTLTGINSYTGGTSVLAGTLALSGSGSISSSTLITVKSGAILDVSASTSFTLAAGQTVGGNGSVAGPVLTAAGAKIAPGESVGTLTFNGALDISGSATGPGGAFLFELATPAASDLVLLPAGASLSIGSEVLDFNDFAFTSLGGFELGTYTLFNSTTPITGTLGSDLGGTVGGFTGILALGDGGNDIVLHVVPIPEPAATGTGILAALGFLLRRRRRSRA
ncbi:MAG: autotransporter-associated beta strand repeat-containing protein [Verrucomicrobiota bacterium]